MRIFGSDASNGSDGSDGQPPRVLLDFGDVEHDLAGGKDLRTGLSAAARVGRNLFVAADEGTALERLSTDDGTHFHGHATFALDELLDLPSGTGEEVDVEGMDYREPYLWIVGSHSLKRSKPDPDTDDPAGEIEKLAEIETEENRYLLARIPLERDPETGEHTPRRSCPDPADPEWTLTAARVKGEGPKSQLLKALAKDPHLGPFGGIPGKDNGLDVEGLAVAGERVFLGLRGPVLRGWATILEVEPKTKKKDPSRLKLRKIGPGGARFRKHFVDLGGLGIRELAADGADLLILAGPTLDMDGPVTLFRWTGGCEPDEQELVGRDRIRKVMDVPYGQGEDAGKDHAEGIALFRDPGRPAGLLVVYDSPVEGRMASGGRVYADLFPLPG
ncbi:MAG TPA: DUF3616 domain-containing protein [Longimicrobiaceae bacterium]|nr:DUF3616 domain-containing protein [Longimicrobiaceae bacterium]